ncbi:hypothetical protein HMN09_00962700 [Mycena chlorophos]|uniref:Uncharacterized protein n=1 Tax=Mycena chlorophos TaxID=658473 RepID=A0A8H6SKM9_MYCCL|nr:hypothetical protein HMN09_00962700 [Mycena chlorophos]
MLYRRARSNSGNFGHALHALHTLHPPAHIRRVSSRENTPPQNHREKSRGGHGSARRRRKAPAVPLRDSNGPEQDPLERIRELEAEKGAIQAEADAAKAEAAALREQQRHPSPSTPSASNDTILRPKNLSKVTMRELRTTLGYTQSRWNAAGTHTRFACQAARLDPELKWQAQDSKKIAKMANVVHVDFPETRRFENDWGIKFIAAQTFSGSKSYRRCADDPNTYRGRKTIERRDARGRNATRHPKPHPNPRPRRQLPALPRLSRVGAAPRRRPIGR